MSVMGCPDSANHQVDHRTSVKDRSLYTTRCRQNPSHYAFLAPVVTGNQTQKCTTKWDPRIFTRSVYTTNVMHGPATKYQ